MRRGPEAGPIFSANPNTHAKINMSINIRIAEISMRIKERIANLPTDWDQLEAADILDQVASMLEGNWHQIQDVADKNNGTLSIALKVDIDHTDPQQRVSKTAISFNQKFKDETELSIIGDPDQGELGL